MQRLRLSSLQLHHYLCQPLQTGRRRQSHQMVNTMPSSSRNGRGTVTTSQRAETATTATRQINGEAMCVSLTGFIFPSAVASILRHEETQRSTLIGRSSPSAHHCFITDTELGLLDWQLRPGAAPVSGQFLRRDICDCCIVQRTPGNVPVVLYSLREVVVPLFVNEGFLSPSGGLLFNPQIHHAHIISGMQYTVPETVLALSMHVMHLQRCLRRQEGKTNYPRDQSEKTSPAQHRRLAVVNADELRRELVNGQIHKWILAGEKMKHGFRHNHHHHDEQSSPFTCSYQSIYHGISQLTHSSQLLV